MKKSFPLNKKFAILRLEFDRWAVANLLIRTIPRDGDALSQARAATLSDAEALHDVMPIGVWFGASLILAF
jgi:hypothetical protein